ncbi:BMP family ABC transporter substrate-binding protein [Niallia sp. XMNu-256]|uniref:BMP family ABC transporter substrate-binding protein n=1 Tax=Niallia sp. XMNu-256 TaxID=3082444 RepID=UPI0030D4907D
MKRVITWLLCLLLFLTSCEVAGKQGELKKVGLLVPETIIDQNWGTKSYKGLLQIQSEYGVDVFYKEGMDSQLVVERAVEEFKQKGVNLIFGHGFEYAQYFSTISLNYPEIHFIVFNGDAKNDNITSLNFEGYAMGFFAGMVAAHTTETNRIGVIPAYEWQPEVQGFYDGAKFENRFVHVEIQYVNDFDDVEKALQIFESMKAQGIDVLYPAGDTYNVPIIEKIKENGLYAIGYISDQSDLGKYTILTSTVQHIGTLYSWVAERLNEGKLESGNLFFDFQDDAISLGTFSSLVDEAYVNKINGYIEEYKETGKLPNQSLNKES